MMLSELQEKLVPFTMELPMHLTQDQEKLNEEIWGVLGELWIGTTVPPEGVLADQ